MTTPISTPTTDPTALKALKALPTSVHAFIVSHRSQIQILVKHLTSKKDNTTLSLKYKATLCAAEETFEMLTDITIKLVDITEVKLHGMLWREQRLTRNSGLFSEDTKAAIQHRIKFQAHVEAYHDAQLATMVQINTEPSLERIRKNMEEAAYDIEALMKCVPGLVGLLQDLVLKGAQYRDQLLQTLGAVDDGLTRDVAHLVAGKYPHGYRFVGVLRTY
ncbi:hypothetical protein BDW02DRAFT_599815 [Decorospora gaudefroyi]|uniref:Uncharacterized protein n=1 Tax=Decorospora gaudefroyi TaxID=184978 RepID=A0A6A5K818_9PLEO|nr:hypothetical protein BDW02DRAFT_599815 [Decorospora gaudefroyi]